jgi:hypothetical protein
VIYDICTVRYLISAVKVHVIYDICTVRYLISAVKVHVINVQTDILYQPLKYM